MAQCPTLKENILICALVSLSFGSSLFGDFVFDDTEALLKNPDLERSLFDTRIFANDFWGTPLHKPESHKSYRPLTILAYKCIRQVSAFLYDDFKLRPLGFRIANLLAYTLLCCLLQSTICLFLASPIIGNSPTRAKNTAFLVTLLFAVHPLHTESVNSAVGLSDILSALCCVFALRVYLNTHNLLRNRKTRKIVSVHFTLRSLVNVFLIGFAILFKEQGITYMVIYFKVCTIIFR